MKITKREWAARLTELRNAQPDELDASIAERHGAIYVTSQIDTELREILRCYHMLGLSSISISYIATMSQCFFKIARLAVLGIILMSREETQWELREKQ